jgi:hypothetical protein
MNVAGRHPGERDPSLQDVVRCLARYLREHPNAGDTVDGIAQWWLGLTPASLGLVECALGELERAAVVVGARAPDGRIHYRRRMPDAHIDAAAIEAALERLGGPCGGPGNAGPAPRG